MLQNNVTNNPNVGILYDLSSIPVELHRALENARNERKTRNATRKRITQSVNPFDIVNNFRRICEREIAEVAGV